MTEHASTGFPGASARRPGRRWLQFTCLALAGYLGVLVTLVQLEDRLLYRPHRRPGNWSLPPAELPIEELWLPTAHGTPIHAWWCPCTSSAGAVLFCHGNAGNLSQRAHDVLAMQRALRKSVLIFDYPGFGRSPGRPSEAGCCTAADAAYDWLTQRVTPERVIILGQSLGGGVAVDLASRRRHQALAVFKTFTSIPDLAQKLFPFVPARYLVHNRFDSLHKIANCSGAVFIAHGDCDHLIPVSQARRLFQAAPEPKRLCLLQGCGHRGGLSPVFLTRLAEFLEDRSADVPR